MMIRKHRKILTLKKKKLTVLIMNIKLRIASLIITSITFLFNTSYSSTKEDIFNLFKKEEIIKSLLKSGNFNEAYEIGNKTLEFWEQKSAEDIYPRYSELLRIAISIESEYYYERIKGKIENFVKTNSYVLDPEIMGYAPYFKFESLANSDIKELSLINILASKMKVDPEFLDKYKMSKAMFREWIEVKLYNLTKHMTKMKGEDAMILLEILDALAINALKNPQEKIYFSSKDPGGNQALLGLYEPNFKNVITHLDVDSSGFDGTLMHELTHKLMDILFNNNATPYWNSWQIYQDSEKKPLFEAYTKAKDQFLARLGKFPRSSDIYHPQLKRTVESMQTVRIAYLPSFEDNEYIARLIQSITCGDPEKSGAVRELLEPLLNYWNKYIRPKIKQYIAENKEYDKFTSDWHQENFTNLYSKTDTRRFLLESRTTADLITLLRETSNRGDLEKAEKIEAFATNRDNLSSDDSIALYYYFKKSGQEEKANNWLQKISKDKEAKGDRWSWTYVPGESADIAAIVKSLAKYGYLKEAFDLAQNNIEKSSNWSIQSINQILSVFEKNKTYKERSLILGQQYAQMKEDGFIILVCQLLRAGRAQEAFDLALNSLENRSAMKSRNLDTLFKSFIQSKHPEMARELVFKHIDLYPPKGMSSQEILDLKKSVESEIFKVNN